MITSRQTTNLLYSDLISVNQPNREDSHNNKILKITVVLLIEAVETTEKEGQRLHLKETPDLLRPRQELATMLSFPSYLLRRKMSSLSVRAITFLSVNGSAKAMEVKGREQDQPFDEPSTPKAPPLWPPFAPTDEHHLHPLEVVLRKVDLHQANG